MEPCKAFVDEFVERIKAFFDKCVVDEFNNALIDVSVESSPMLKPTPLSNDAADWKVKIYQKIKNIRPWTTVAHDNITLSTSSLISLSFQGDPTIFHKGIFLKQTLHIKN